MATVTGPEAQRRLRIEPGNPWAWVDLRELLDYRELLFFLIWRDVKTRYVQTALGGIWGVIQPLVSMVIFTVVFGRLAGIQSEYKVPYALFIFTGLLPWTYFASSLGAASRSVVGNANLVSKVFVPRLLLPLAAVVVPLVDFALSFVVLIGLFIVFGFVPHWHAIAIPVFLGMALLVAFGVGLWFAALNVRYRDISYLVPFLIQMWFFLTPVIYPVALVPPRLHWLLALNPMAGVIDGFRWAVLGRGLPHYGVYALSTSVGLVLTISGLWYFKRVERSFADDI